MNLGLLRPRFTLCEGEGHSPSPANFSERLYEDKVFTHALHDFLALTESTQLGEPTCQYSYFEKGQQKNVLATIPNGNLGYDQYAVLDPVAVESSIVAFL